MDQRSTSVCTKRGLAWAAACFLLLVTVAAAISLPVVHDGIEQLLHSRSHKSSDSELPPIRMSPFVKKLLSEMSLREKIGQMTQLDIQSVMAEDGVTLDEAKLIEGIRDYGVGSYLNSPYFAAPINGKSSSTPRDWGMILNRIQELSQKHHNHSVPILYGLDSVHGANYIYGATMFPHNLGIAASFNKTATYVVRRIGSKDTRAVGAAWNFDPVADVGMNPLWPRLYETFGEDPYLVSEMVRASVHGIEGEDMKGEDDCACSLKHFVGYSDPKSGKDRTAAWIGDRQLRQYFLPPFQAGIEAGAKTIMINSGSINGIPVHSSPELLTDLLRKELRFEGVAVTDYHDLQKLTYFHKVAPTFRDGIKMGVVAGIDMSMVPMDFTFSILLEELVLEGVIPESRVEQSAARILQLKEDLGLFRNSMVDVDGPKIRSIGSQQDRDAAVQVARETITLLKNENNVLPLSNVTTKRILVTGPCGNSLSCQSGGWSIHWQGALDSEFPFGTSIAEGIRKQLELAGNTDATVDYIEGASFMSVTDVEEAVRLAREADVVVLAVGEPPEAETPGDTNDLALSVGQRTLYDALAHITKAPIVTIMVSARPKLFGQLVESNATLMAFLPGPEGGQAIAEILFGAVNPSGRLPITYPQFSGDINVPYYHLHSAATSPLFEFGHGLSYTQFKYSNLVVDKTRLKAGESLRASVTVTNVGKIEGQESILLFVSDLFATVCPEVKLLKAFHKVSIAPGQSVTHTFELAPEAFSHVGRDLERVIEAGEFVLRCGDLSTHVHVDAE